MSARTAEELRRVAENAPAVEAGHRWAEKPTTWRKRKVCADCGLSFSFAVWMGYATCDKAPAAAPVESEGEGHRVWNRNPDDLIAYAKQLEAEIARLRSQESEPGGADEIRALRAERDRYRVALHVIADEQSGWRFKRDPLEHARSVVEEMREMARRALTPESETNPAEPQEVNRR